MKKKKGLLPIPLELQDTLEISLVGNPKKSSLILRQIKELLVYTPNLLRFSVGDGTVELTGTDLACSVFWNGSFRIIGCIQRIEISRK